ncbi:DMT family transporter [Jatrophihabitans telluris]|uniref:DMT family transporter n=1 Tax=Jatrophihabitans telluris TaxID=2038343 RepID=A0ABY4QZP6_9ACTN|nr:DMT family transporter [Jatrophihabitans telluris]UQX88476.1 DMT family transporter [Jatrophihabitans telluris]
MKTRLSGGTALAYGSGFALLSAATFGTSGSFATSLMGAGWSSGAAVTVRITVAALVLALPGAYQLRGKWAAVWRERWSLALYGLVAVAGCQLFFFNAVNHLSVGVALLLEYSGTLLVVLWLWASQGKRPSRTTALGIAASVLGLVLVLQIWNERQLDLVGLAWGLAAAVGLAVFFVISARTDSELPPVASAWVGMSVGALALAASAAVGVLPLHASTRPVTLAGTQLSWLVSVAGLSLVAAVVAYCAGISAARRLGATVASFFGLTEVLFAVFFAWVLLSEKPSGIQAVGGLAVLVGIALIQLGERGAPTH